MLFLFLHFQRSRRSGADMRKYLIFLLLASFPLISQTAPKPTTKPAVKKPIAVAAAQPVAIIDTTAGKPTRPPFPDKGPLRLAQFYVLAPRSTAPGTPPH